MQLFKTAESVSPKHPDKICDIISDTILDACLTQDPFSRVAMETMGGHGLVTVTGELTTNAQIDIPQIINQVLGEEVEINTRVVVQSPEIAQGVDTGGAGDQGIMVGYATSSNPSLIPEEAFLSRDLNRVLFAKYNSDGKTQITLKEGVITHVVASFQYAKKAELINEINNWLANKKVDSLPAIHANPAGDWDLGGFTADTGLTGRKLAVDNYGPLIPVGGGAFSGKDATKVDRSAAYMARKVAVDYLQKYGAKEVFCYLAYAIGVAEPVQATVVVDGKEEEIKGYDLTPKGIINFLDLQKPQFAQTARYGHFGNGFKWDI